MNIIEEQTYHFSIRILQIYSKVRQVQKDVTPFRQLLRSGTSIGANVQEAHGAQSQRDFIQKMSIAQKEAKETIYWLSILTETGYLDKIDGSELLEKVRGINKILCRILITAKTTLLKISP
jgi:four helix bundle protein